MVAGFQRFRNALYICHLLYQPKKKLLRLSVNVRKIGVQFTTCQQSGISHTAMLLEIAEMPLPPYPDWLIFLRLIIPGNQVIVSNQFIFQPCAFIRDKSFHSYNLLFLSAIIVAGGIAEIECAGSKKRRLGITPKTALFCCGSERTLHGEAAAEEIGVRPIPVWWS